MSNALPIVFRGELHQARLAPGTEGSEQSGIRPVIIVSRDAINRSSGVVLIVPCTTYQEGDRIYPSQVLINPGDVSSLGSELGLTNVSIALGEQVRSLAKRRLLGRRGVLSSQALALVDGALRNALDI